MPKDTEWTFVTELVAKYLVDNVEPREQLRDHFPDEFVDDLDLTNKARVNANTVVKAVQKAGLRGDDPLVLRLLGALVNEPRFAPREECGRVRQMLEREEQAYQLNVEQRAAEGDPFLITVMAGNEVFLNRTGLRQSLRELHEGTDQKLLLQVHGERSTGKSYSARLINHLAGECGFSRGRVFLEDETGTPDEVVRSLAMDIATADAEPPPRQGDPGKWYGRASQWLVTKARDQENECWFVIDGLNHLPPTSEVWDLVQKLALNVDRYGDGYVRLVLLGYDGIFDRNLDQRYLQDEVKCLTEEDVREFFAERLVRGNEQKAEAERADEVQLAERGDEKVSDVMDRVQRKQSEGASFMEALAQAVREVLAELDD